MEDPTNDFISRETRQFRFKIGHIIASSLSGFLAGVAVASMIWYLALVALK